MIYTVKDIQFTHGSFGQPNWTLEDENNIKHSFAMWMDIKDPLWATIGEKVEINKLPPMKIHFGGGSYININNCAEIVKKLP